MSKVFPRGPWENSVLEEGEYEAAILTIESRSYHEGRYFQVILRLIDTDDWLVTNIYVQPDTLSSAKQRVWHLCNACGLPSEGFYDRLGEFSGKRLRVSLKTIKSSRANANHPYYSDVDKFLVSSSPVDTETPEVNTVSTEPAAVAKSSWKEQPLFEVEAMCKKPDCPSFVQPAKTGGKK